jgi:hypothetical protein
MALHEVDIWNRALSRVGDKRLVLESGVATGGTDATAANPVVVTTAAAHGYTTGNHVLIRGFTQMTEVNDRVFRITVLTTTTFELDDEDGSGYTAETTGGTIYKLPAAKAAKACFDAWADARDEVLEEHPWNGVVKRSRLARLEAAKTITAATAADPVVITTSGAHGYSLGEVVLIEGIVGMTELNDRWFTVGTVPTTTTFELAGENGTTHAAWSAGGTTKRADTPFVPDSGYDYRYTLPTDCLRMLEIVESKHEWVVEGREVHTNDGITVPIRYIFRQKDVTAYRPALASMMAYRLAVDLIEELTQSTSKQERALALYEFFLARAKRVDSQEQSPMPLEEDDWVESRL